MKNVVSITQNYALSADDRNYVLQRRHIVDPTKAPGYKADDSGDAPVLKETWRDVGYYPLNADGLKSAVLAAVVRDVNDATEARTIAELLAEYRDATDALTFAVYNALETRK